MVEATSPGRTARVVTSTNFVLRPVDDTSNRVELVVADTTVSALPFDETFEFGSSLRFFVQASLSDTSEAVLTLRVFVDGEKRWDETRAVRGTALEFQFIFG